MRPAAVKLLAAIKGVIRSESGEPLQATVHIVEAKARARAGADGSFLLKVPGGRYTLTIEMKGFVSQSRTIEVADGDQAIFSVDLHPGH